METHPEWTVPTVRWTGAPLFASSPRPPQQRIPRPLRTHTTRPDRTSGGELPIMTDSPVIIGGRELPNTCVECHRTLCFSGKKIGIMID
jgi:hypothetical protein